MSDENDENKILKANAVYKLKQLKWYIQKNPIMNKNIHMCYVQFCVSGIELYFLIIFCLSPEKSLL